MLSTSSFLKKTLPFCFILMILTFCSQQVFSQSANNPKKDTASSYYDKEAFEKELKELLGIKDEPKKEDRFITQVKELIGAGSKNFKSIIVSNSLKISSGDSVYNSSYKVDGAGKTTITIDKERYISYSSELRIDNNKTDAVNYYKELLVKLQAGLGADYTFKKLDLGVNFSNTVVIKKKKNQDGVDIFFSLDAIGGKYITDLTLRKEMNFVNYEAEWGN